MNKFFGTGVALITPFKNDLSVDVAALKNLVRFQIENGVDYLVVLGTTAENATLNQAEKQLVMETVIAENKGRLPLVLGIGGNSTSKVIEDFHSINLDAFDAVLSVSPYYNKPTQEGIYQHFKAIAEASSKPIILYNVPGRTASNILPTTVKRLATDFEKIIGIKEAAGDIVQAMNLKALLPKNFLIISGDDMLALPIILAGGHGVISVIGQGFPLEFSEMVRLGLQKEVEKAYELHYKIAPSIALIFSEGNPSGIKTILEKKGLLDNNLRLPLVKASEGLTKKITSFVDEFYN